VGESTCISGTSSNRTSIGSSNTEINRDKETNSKAENVKTASSSYNLSYRLFAEKEMRDKMKEAVREFLNHPTKDFPILVGVFDCTKEAVKAVCDSHLRYECIHTYLHRNAYGYLIYITDCRSEYSSMVNRVCTYILLYAFDMHVVTVAMFIHCRIESSARFLFGIMLKVMLLRQKERFNVLNVSVII
jgi:hypothetical protein